MYCYHPYLRSYPYRTRWVKLNDKIWYDYDSGIYYNEGSKRFAFHVAQTNQWLMWDGQKWVPYDANVFYCEGVMLLGVCSGAP